MVIISAIPLNPFSDFVPRNEIETLGVQVGQLLVFVVEGRKNLTANASDILSSLSQRVKPNQFIAVCAVIAEYWADQGLISELRGEK